MPQNEPSDEELIAEALGGFSTNVMPNPSVEGGTARQLRLLTWVTYTLLFVLALGFGALLVAVVAIAADAFANKAASYQNLQDEVQAQNTKIDDLIEALKETEPTVPPKPQVIYIQQPSS